jgi:DNA-directed RNA polymerase subunit RPC12/RpoP
MHHKRKVVQGSGMMDPRHRTYHIYECALCNHTKDIDQRPGLNTDLLIKCPNCGVTNDTDNTEALIKRKHQLEQQIKQLSVELAAVSKELLTVQGATHAPILLPEPTNLSTS